MPTRPGLIERVELEYKRHGTLCLIANFDVVTGKAIYWWALWKSRKETTNPNNPRLPLGRILLEEVSVPGEVKGLTGIIDEAKQLRAMLSKGVATAKGVNK